MTLFKSLKISTNNTISNKERKKTEKQIGIELDKETKVFKGKKIALLGQESDIFAFLHGSKWIFTLNYLRKLAKKDKPSPYTTIFIDSGAKEPIKRGCDIFKPGINKYRHLITQEFTKGEVVTVNIVDYGVFAVAEALIDFSELDNEKGTGFKVLTCEGDELDLFQ